MEGSNAHSKIGSEIVDFSCLIIGFFGFWLNYLAVGRPINWSGVICVLVFLALFFVLSSPWKSTPKIKRSEITPWDQAKAYLILIIIALSIIFGLLSTLGFQPFEINLSIQSLALFAEGLGAAMIVWLGKDRGD